MAKKTISGRKNAIFGIFLSKNGCFFMLAGLKTLLCGLQSTKRMPF